MSSRLLVIAIPLAAILTSCVRSQVTPSPEAQRYSFSVVQSWPHDPAAFTQGLELYKGVLYEGTGRHGQSEVRKVDLSSGRVLAAAPLPAEHFGEGITIFQGSLFQLTWKSGICFVRDPETLSVRRELRYEGEGWGLTHDEQHLIMSDGSANLTFRDPASFRVVRTVEVVDQGLPVTRLNELEYIRGEVFANVWLTDMIAKIDPASGRVTGWIDLGTLLPPEKRGPEGDVLNGIAFDAGGDRILVTGKLWPALFHVQLRKME